MANLAGDAVIDATLTWEKQKQAYSDWFGLAPGWRPVSYLAQAGNAAAHGLGQLTRRQLRKEQRTVTLIKNAKIAVSNRRIELTEQNLGEASETCRTFIEEVDGLALNRRTPSLPPHRW